VLPGPGEPAGPGPAKPAEVGSQGPVLERMSLRQLFGWGIVLAGLLALVADLHQYLAQHNPAMAAALLGGLIAAGATALGTLPVALSQTLSQRTNDTMLGFGAGVMLAACAFSLVIPALEAARDQGAGTWGAGLLVAVAVLLGGMLLLLIDRLVPHEHFIKGPEGPGSHALKRAWLFVLAIALHNMPEGLAIGVAFAGPDRVGAQALATGIAIQDVPEGLVVALALFRVGYRRSTAVLLGIASGLVEPVFAVIGAAVLALSAGLLPWGLALAAGAMLFVISHEIIPESHRQGHEAHATTGLMLGFVLMMVLDTSLG
jgi:zinc transporter, ZIP family